MRGLHVVVGVALIAALCGCQANPAARREIAILKAEILDLEDQYYRLKSEFRTTTGQESMTHQTFRQRAAGSVNGELACDDVAIEESQYGYPIERPASELPWNSPTNESTTPSQSRASILETEQRDQEQLNHLDRNMEEIDLRSPENNGGGVEPARTPSAEQWQRRNRQSQSTPRTGLIDANLETVNFESPASEQSRANELTLIDEASANIVSINVASNISGGYDRDGRDGDDGMYVFVQALDQAGQPIPAPGAIWISLIDPQLPPAEQRVGLWKLAEIDVAQANRKYSDEKPGVDFYLPWIDAPPRHEELSLYVRWIGAQGQFSETNLLVRCRVANAESDTLTRSLQAKETLESNHQLWRPDR